MRVIRSHQLTQPLNTPVLSPPTLSIAMDKRNTLFHSGNSYQFLFINYFQVHLCFKYKRILNVLTYLICIFCFGTIFPSNLSITLVTQNYDNWVCGEWAVGSMMSWIQKCLSLVCTVAHLSVDATEKPSLLRPLSLMSSCLLVSNERGKLAVMTMVDSVDNGIIGFCSNNSLCVSQVS